MGGWHPRPDVCEGAKLAQAVPDWALLLVADPGVGGGVAAGGSSVPFYHHTRHGRRSTTSLRESSGRGVAQVFRPVRRDNPR